MEASCSRRVALQPSSDIVAGDVAGARSSCRGLGNGHGNEHALDEILQHNQIS